MEVVIRNNWGNNFSLFNQKNFTTVHLNYNLPLGINMIDKIHTCIK